MEVLTILLSQGFGGRIDKITREPSRALIEDCVGD
jgi:hypothetical protein